jgi:hypothetical protein
MQRELKSCPICGSSVHILISNSPDQFEKYKIACIRSTCKIQTPYYCDENLMIDRWNKRTQCNEN